MLIILFGNLNNGMNAFFDWNLILNSSGGPNHVSNFCCSPIMLTKDNKNYIKTLTYFYIGHFSKYIKPKAIRIGYSKFTNKIEVSSFQNPDGSIVVVLFNQTNEDVNFNLYLNGSYFHDNLAKHSIVSFVIS